MERLNPQKLFVEFRNGVTKLRPIIPRRYTLTHSDITAELFLTIGKYYAYDKINPTRDEVLAEWKIRNNRYIFCVYVYVDGKFRPMNTYIRNKIFIRELPLALEAIRFGDKEFFNIHPYLDNAPVFVYFDSINPYFNRIEYWGTLSDYK
ncbi:staygreen family protein [Thermohalobacter berrensis]|uniref:Staygreen protein domain-containing protein n=1 Tax=Thermohalobacter berrensis TaxID=99594 RepID=A0A419SWA6_9FIRM|nr:staygreen family protein [Thermohalobacter berrensis]RKD29514.1 hypothetical protein BET03_05495 [Thermohalobacter berrensis]